MLNAALEPAENMLADGLDGDGLSSGEMLMECVVKVQNEFLCTCTPLSSHCIVASLCNFVVPLTVCVCVCVRCRSSVYTRSPTSPCHGSANGNTAAPQVASLLLVSGF